MKPLRSTLLLLALSTLPLAAAPPAKMPAAPAGGGPLVMALKPFDKNGNFQIEKEELADIQAEIKAHPDSPLKAVDLGADGSLDDVDRAAMNVKLGQAAMAGKKPAPGAKNPGGKPAGKPGAKPAGALPAQAGGLIAALKAFDKNGNFQIEKEEVPAIEAEIKAHPDSPLKAVDAGGDGSLDDVDRAAMNVKLGQAAMAAKKKPVPPKIPGGKKPGNK